MWSLECDNDLMNQALTFSSGKKYNISKIKIVRGGMGMKKYVCDVCGYVYDPAAGDADSGITAGTAFEGIPDDWVCPVCGVTKDMFKPE